MKKLTSRETFSFDAGNGEVLAISPEGTLASDEAAKIITTRFGGLVQIEEADVKAEVNKVLAGDTSVKVTDRMGRPELEAIASGEGATTEAIAAAKTKGELVALIETLRAAKTPAEPAVPNT